MGVARLLGAHEACAMQACVYQQRKKEKKNHAPMQEAGQEICRLVKVAGMMQDVRERSAGVNFAPTTPW